MRMPRVSILMATNKCDDYFRLALDSCLGQTFSDFELILVANGMSDLDFENLKKLCVDPRIFLYRTDIRRLTFSLNLGLHYCRGEGRLAKQVAFMANNPDISICGSFCDLIDSDQKVVGGWKYPISNKDIRRSLLWICPLCHPSVIYRRKVVIDQGGYFGFFAEDYALWVFLSGDKNVKFANIPESLIAYRANAADHPRSGIKRKSKASCAGTQFQKFAATFDVRWLFAALLSVAKIIFYAR
jgi:glycosyltransferase involved in cell wall biosynthesis